MPNLTPTLNATIAKFDKRGEPITRVFLNPAEAAFLKVGEHFSKSVPPDTLISSAAGTLNGSILVVAWDLIPKKQVSIIQGDEHGLMGVLDDIQPDPHFFVPLRYLEEPLYELGEKVWASIDSENIRKGNIQGVLKVESFEDTQLCSLRYHHLTLIEGPIPESMLGVGAGIHYWVTGVRVWVPESEVSHLPD